LRKNCYLILFFLISFSVSAEKIVTIKLSYIFENSNDYVAFIEKLNKKKDQLQKQFEIKEKELIDKKQEIEESKILLSEEEMNITIDKFNEETLRFNENMNYYNALINENIELNKNIVLKEIALIVRNLSIENNYELILNEDQYFLSSDHLDISEIIIKILNNKNIDLIISEKIK